MNTLTGSDAIHMATVLEDCIDQLVILGRIMPVAYHEKPNAAKVTMFIYCNFFVILYNIWDI